MAMAHSGIVNDFELRVFGLQRSGIHAIVNWIVQQSGGPTVFINDIKSLTENPYNATDDFHWFNDGVGLRMRDVSRERNGNLSAKRYLVLGYEDTDLSRIPSEFDELLTASVGRSGVRRNVLVVRDAFNLFASRLGFTNTANRHPIRTHREHVLSLWRCHAREALGETEFLGKDTVVIRFNRWFVDREYRRAISDMLGLTFTDAGLETVPSVDLPRPQFARFGCGSSFDNQRFNGRAQEMDVLSRWARFDGDPFFAELFADSQIRVLSERLFGPIEGTEGLGLR